MSNSATSQRIIQMIWCVHVSFYLCDSSSTLIVHVFRFIKFISLKCELVTKCIMWNVIIQRGLAPLGMKHRDILDKISRSVFNPFDENEYGCCTGLSPPRQSSSRSADHDPFRFHWLIPVSAVQVRPASVTGEQPHHRPCEVSSRWRCAATCLLWSE